MLATAPKPEIVLPSKAVLKIQIAPFAVSKALYQALLRELRGIPVTTTMEIGGFYKDAFCAAYSAPEVEDCLWKCFERCTIDGAKIDKDTFEPVERREDYITVCMEVARANVFPFVKSLYVSYQEIMEVLEANEKGQGSKSPKTI